MPEFLEPQWDAPVDVDAEIRAQPEGAVIKGMFPQALLVEAERRGLILHPARDRYLPFLDYPVTEQIALVYEAARAFYPDLPVRQGLRKLGRAAIAAFMQTTIGRVVMNAEGGVHETLVHLMKAYDIARKHPVAEIVNVDLEGRTAHLRLRECYLLDSNQVGVVEGVLRLALGRGRTINVRVFAESPVTGELWCAWE